MTLRQILGCLYLLAICTVLWPIELVWYKLNRNKIMKLTTLLSMMAVATMASAADVPPFKYDTNKLRRIVLPDGSWALVAKNNPADPWAEVPKDAAAPAKTESWLSRLSIAPLGAIRTVDLNGHSEWGFGIDVGVAVNPFVSLHVANLAFEGPGHSKESPQHKDGHTVTTGPHSWGGSAIDETDLLVKAIISPFSTEKLSVYASAGGVRVWGEDERWGLSAGGGVAYNFNKTFSVAGDYSVRMYSEPDSSGSSLDSLLRALVRFEF